MRIIGFSEKWGKLKNDILFTTFRFPRRDKDWEVEEIVQVVYKPRAKTGVREPLGIARIIRKEVKDVRKEWSYYPRISRPYTPDMITPDEAKEDGFTGMHGGGDINKLIAWLRKPEYFRIDIEPVHKLTLYWIEKFND